MRRFLALLVLLATGVVPLAPMECPMGTDEPVSAMAPAGQEGHAGHDPQPGEGLHAHHPGPGDSAGRGEGHHQGSHPGDAGCRSGSACGASGVVAQLSAPAPAPLPAREAPIPVADSWATFTAGHETPPPRLPV